MIFFMSLRYFVQILVWTTWREIYGAYIEWPIYYNPHSPPATHAIREKITKNPTKDAYFQSNVMKKKKKKNFSGMDHNIDKLWLG